MADDEDNSKKTLSEKLSSAWIKSPSTNQVVEKFVRVAEYSSYTKKEQALQKLQELSPYADEKGGISPLEQARKKLFSLVSDYDIDGVTYNIELEALDIQEEAKPIMTIYQLCVMLPPPIFSHIHRAELQHGIFSAIQEWGMSICADRIKEKTGWVVDYPDTLDNPRLFDRIPTEDTRIHIDVFQKYAIEGKITKSAVQYAKSWREYIRLHEERIRLEKSHSLNKQTKELSGDQKEKQDRCIQSAKYFAKNIRHYLKKQEKVSLFSVFRRVMEKEEVSKSWLYENFPEKEKKEIRNILINNK